MGYLQRTLRYFNQHFLKLSWLALVLILLSHFFLALGMMYLAGEDALISDWFYYYITTATTIGYGDLSPSSYSGRLMASLFVLPGAVVLFAGFLGKLTTFFIDFWRRGMQGKGDYSELSNHIVILGWNARHTPRMIELIYGDTRREEREVILCTTEDIENPFPDQILFVKGESLNDSQLLKRASLDSAARVIIYRDSDDATLATCLTVAARKTQAHIVAWFENLQMASLLKSHCPEVESHTNISMELMVRSAQDPGSSRLQSQLLSTLIGPTQYSVRVPDSFNGVTFGRLMEFFKVRHEAIALGIADSATGDDLKLNPKSTDTVVAGQVVYYLSAERIRSNEVYWQEL